MRRSFFDAFQVHIVVLFLSPSHINQKTPNERKENLKKKRKIVVLFWLLVLKTKNSFFLSLFLSPPRLASIPNAVSLSLPLSLCQPQMFFVAVFFVRLKAGTLGLSPLLRRGRASLLGQRRRGGSLGPFRGCLLYTSPSPRDS